MANGHGPPPSGQHWGNSILTEIGRKLDKVSEDVAEIRAWKNTIDLPRHIRRIEHIEKERALLVHVSDLEKTNEKLEKVQNTIRIGVALALGGGFGSGFGIAKYGEQILSFLTGF